MASCKANRSTSNPCECCCSSLACDTWQTILELYMLRQGLPWTPLSIQGMFFGHARFVQTRIGRESKTRFPGLRPETLFWFPDGRLSQRPAKQATQCRSGVSAVARARHVTHGRCFRSSACCVRVFYKSIRFLAAFRRLAGQRRFPAMRALCY